MAVVTQRGKPTDYFDSAFYDPPSFVRSSSAPMYSLDIPSETWGNDTTSVPSHGGATSSSNQIGPSGAGVHNVAMYNNHDQTSLNYRNTNLLEANKVIGDSVLSASNSEIMAPEGPRGTSSMNSPWGSDEGKNTGIDINNLPMPAVAPPNSVEALIIQGCAEILQEASSHTLKAVELANTLRAGCPELFGTNSRKMGWSAGFVG